MGQTGFRAERLKNTTITGSFLHVLAFYGASWIWSIFDKFYIIFQKPLFNLTVFVMFNLQSNCSLLFSILQWMPINEGFISINHSGNSCSCRCYSICFNKKNVTLIILFTLCYSKLVKFPLRRCIRVSLNEAFPVVKPDS